MGIRDWLAIIVIIFIVLILLDGFRRKWLERRNRIVLKLDKSPSGAGGDEEDVLVKSELPNGGARTKKRDGDDEVPVLMESVDLDDEEIAEFPETADTDEGDDGDSEGPETLAGTLAEEEAEDELPPEGSADNDLPEDYAHDEDTADSVDQDEDPWTSAATSVSSRQAEPESATDAAAASETGTRGKRGFLSRDRSGERIEPTFGDQELTFGRDDQGELDLETNDLFETSDDEDGEDEDQQDIAEQVLIINVMARPDKEIEGSKLLPVLLKHGMRLGDMSIFHRHADVSGKGPVMFSMANMLKPGTFSMSEMETFTTKGISFFMQLPNKVGNMQCFEQMLETAEAVKTELDAQLKDENRSVFTRQTIEHSRQRIRDFELEMLARK